MFPTSYGKQQCRIRQLSDFTPDAGKEVKNAVIALKEKGAKGIILDLRGNPGGLLLEAVNICNIFLAKGNLVVSTKGKVEDSNFVYETSAPPVDTEIPLAVLINRAALLHRRSLPAHYKIMIVQSL